MKYLLLLHGYTQNSEKFYKTITKLLSKTFLDNYSVICPDGCYIVNKEEKKYGWWKLPSPKMFSLPHKDVNFEKSVKYVKEYIPQLKENDTLDIIAFSQGTILAEYMIYHQLLEPCKVILFSPSGVMDTEHQKLKKVVNCDVLVVIGEKEGVFVVTHKNYAKVSCITNYEKETHQAGHVISTNSKSKKLIKIFLFGG